MKKVFVMLAISFLLSGCWDQLQLKKLLFVDVVGIDYEGDSNLLNVNYVISSLRNAQQGGGDPSGLYLRALTYMTPLQMRTRNCPAFFPCWRPGYI
ncbi:hypothetical protein [Paenibacillus sp. MMS18-CY102]|uniref:hypothetical protein n=1 Tax=Paenibacillus sp. MMS18-CY102 TaxID=2682849 RepID=UPI001F367D3A|nr:hypothetical protein [Paenibacillus sp. MMS18-CY102]